MECAILPSMENLFAIYIYLKLAWNDATYLAKMNAAWYLPLRFLLSVCPSPEADDVELNAYLFRWPEKILKELEESKVRLAATREETEDFIEQR